MKATCLECGAEFSGEAEAAEIALVEHVGSQHGEETQDGEAAATEDS